MNVLYILLTISLFHGSFIHSSMFACFAMIFASTSRSRPFPLHILYYTIRMLIVLINEKMWITTLFKCIESKKRKSEMKIQLSAQLSHINVWVG